MGHALDQVDLREFSVELAQRVGCDVNDEIPFAGDGIDCLDRIHLAQCGHDVGIAFVGAGRHGEAVDGLLQLVMVDSHAVAGNNPSLFQAIDSLLYCGARDPNLACQRGRWLAGVKLQKRKQLLVFLGQTKQGSGALLIHGKLRTLDRV